MSKESKNSNLTTAKKRDKSSSSNKERVICGRKNKTNLFL